MTLARTLMVQGTSSSVGKSLLVTALCRIFRNRGVNVSPFKAQNMSLNAAVTPDGLEIGRAQAVQAEACGLLPRVEMNPILLKPEGDQRSQLVLMGKAVGHVSAASYYTDDRRALKDVIASSLHTLRSEHQLVIIEGAGSPAELNLKHRDLVNMYVAQLADAPVLLVGDIDRGGVFASLLGTLDLLDEDERARVVALVVNKFRGDITLFRPGVELLEQRSGKPVLGVVPYVRGLQIADEDSQSIDERKRGARATDDQLDVVVLRLPRMSNHDDVLSLEHEPGVVLRFVDNVDDVRNADLVIIPGSKSTVADLAWLRDRGFEPLLAERAQRGAAILGVCGGCQMLGETIEDPSGVESPQARVEGLGLLALRTRFSNAKVTAQVTVQVRSGGALNFLTQAAACSGLQAYEIHQGSVEITQPDAALFEVRRGHDNTAVIDGVTNHGGNVVGTLLHGLLDNLSVRAAMLAGLRQRRGLPTPVVAGFPRSQEIDRLAAEVEGALNMDLLLRALDMAGAPRP